MLLLFSILLTCPETVANQKKTYFSRHLNLNRKNNQNPQVCTIPFFPSVADITGPHQCQSDLIVLLSNLVMPTGGREFSAQFEWNITRCRCSAGSSKHFSKSEGITKRLGRACLEANGSFHFKDAAIHSLRPIPVVSGWCVIFPSI